MILRELEKDPTAKQGYKLLSYPAELKNLISNYNLLGPKQLPGIYGLYFPSINKVYIGQSKNITQEISMYRTGKRTQILLNQAIQQEKGQLIGFSFFQGPRFNDTAFRRKVEEMLIKETVTNNLNIKMTARQALERPSDLIEQGFIETRVITGSLTQYGLNYTGHVPPRDQSCIYLFLNPKTKHFYIGETTNFFTAKVMKRHRSNIYASFKRQKANIRLVEDNRIAPIIADLSNEQNILLFTAIKDMDNATKNERLSEEEQARLEASRQYKNRLYNPPTQKSKMGQLTQTSQAKDLIREASLNRNITIDTTPYPCICEGKWYNNRAEASRAYGYKTNDGLKYKLADPKQVDFIWLKDTQNKPIPNDPQIIQKIKEWKASFQVKAKRIINRYPPENGS